MCPLAAIWKKACSGGGDWSRRASGGGGRSGKRYSSSAIRFTCWDTGCWYEGWGLAGNSLTGLTLWLRGLTWWLTGLTWWLTGLTWWLTGLTWWLTGLTCLERLSLDGRRIEWTLRLRSRWGWELYRSWPGSIIDWKGINFFVDFLKSSIFYSVSEF